MLSSEEILKIISTEIEKLNAPKAPEGLYLPIKYTLTRSGKRIRPLLTIAAFQMFDNRIHKAIPAALALELFHNFTLLHDDVMDNSPVRRGEPTVHKKWNENTAILSGDAMLIEAYKILAKSEPKYLPKLLDIFNKTALEVCEGQQYDMEFENRNDVQISEYLEMIRLKTSVLIAACLKIGAVLGNAEEEICEKLYDFGIEMGLAFQLQDDLLDTFGTEAQFGKRIGGDILEQKKTYLLLKAYETADEMQKQKLNTLFLGGNISEFDKIQGVTTIFNELKIKEKTMELIEQKHKNALSILNTLKIDEQKKQILYDFAEMLMNRQK